MGRNAGGRRRILRKIIVYLIVGYVVWCAGLVYMQDGMIFPRHVAPRPFAALPDPDTIELSIEIDGGEVVGWYKPAPGASAGSPKPVVFFFHGNGEIIDQNIGIAEPYHRLGCSVFLPEYRGYGRANGKPSEQVIVQDCERFYDDLTNRPDVDSSKIVFHGRSLGGGVAAGLAAKRKSAAMILESTFVSIRSYARRYLVPGSLVRHPFRTDRVIAGTDIPLLVFHGANDEIVPVEHGRKLSQLAPFATYVEYPCGHLDLPQGPREKPYWREIEALLRRAGVIGEGNP